MNKLISIILLSLPTLLFGQDKYILEQVRIIQFDSVLYDGECASEMTVSPQSVKLTSESSYSELMVLTPPDSSGYSILGLVDKSTQWQLKITPSSELMEKRDDNFEDYLIEFNSYDPKAVNNIYYTYLGYKEQVFYDSFPPIENMTLNVFDYLYIDSFGKQYSENSNTEPRAKGYYDSVKVKSDGNCVALTFQLKKEYQKRKETHETFTYKAIEYGIERDAVYWVLERVDGVILTFAYSKHLNSYSLSIPVDEGGKELKVYIFTKA